MADEKMSDLYTQATGTTSGNTDSFHFTGGNYTFPLQVYPYPEYTYWYDYPVCKCKKTTKLTLEGTPEEVADLIRHFACRLKITIESMGEDN